MEARNFSTEIERMVSNYTVMGFLDDKQYDSIMGSINRVLNKPTLKRDGNIIYFPGAWQDQKPPEPPKPPPYPYVQEFLKEQGIRFRLDLVFALNELGAYDLQTISAISRRKLKSCRGVGEKSIAKLRAFLQSNGLDLKE